MRTAMLAGALLVVVLSMAAPVSAGDRATTIAFLDLTGATPIDPRVEAAMRAILRCGPRMSLGGCRWAHGSAHTSDAYGNVILMPIPRTLARSDLEAAAHGDAAAQRRLYRRGLPADGTIVFETTPLAITVTVVG